MRSGRSLTAVDWHSGQRIPGHPLAEGPSVAITADDHQQLARRLTEPKKRTALMRELKEVFRRYRSRPIEQVISLINPVLRGWVNYFAVGHSSECFSSSRTGWRRRSGASWRMLGNARASVGTDGVGSGCTTL